MGTFYTYGKYTGALWTGGVFVKDGERGNYDVMPVDYSDYLTRTHDWRFANADDAKAAGYTDVSNWITRDANRELLVAMTRRFNELNEKEFLTGDENSE